MAKKNRNSSRVDGITVREVGRRTYEVDFSVAVAGKSYRFRRMSPFKAVGQSREWARQHRDDLLERGRTKGRKAPRVDPSAPRSFAYWAKKYLADAENPARRGGANRPSTVETKHACMNVHLLPCFAGTPINAITDEEIEGYVQRKVQGQGLATGTVANHVARLCSVIRFAKRKGKGVERTLEVPEVRVKKIPRRVPSTLSEEESARVLRHFAKDEPPWKYAVLAVLFRQGLRIGEALGLRWGDLDFGLDQLHVQRTFSTAFGVGPTKGGKPRTLPLHWQARAALLEIRAESWEPWNWIFESPRRQKDCPRSYYGIRSAFIAGWDECGFKDKNGEPLPWRSHIGRHSLGRHWAERGWPLKGLQEFLGHSDLKTTMIYTHWSASATAPLLQQLGHDSRPDTEDLARRLQAAGVSMKQLEAAGLGGRVARAG